VRHAQEFQPGPVDAVLGDLPVDLLDVFHPGGAVVGQRLAAVGVELGVGAAADLGRGVPDAARVEPDQVEAAGQVGAGEVGRHGGDGVHGRRARPAGVDHQRTDALARGRHPDDGQLCLRPFRIRIVDRHADHPALGGGQGDDGADEARAAAPDGGRRRRGVRKGERHEDRRHRDREQHRD
jgi:hypothetical protein